MEAGEEGLGGLDRIGREGQVGHGVAERQQGLPASRAAGDVLGEQAVRLRGILTREAPEGIARHQLVDALVLLPDRSAIPVGPSRQSSVSSTLRSLRSAANVLVFTVPSGMPSSSAIRTWVLPSK